MNFKLIPPEEQSRLIAEAVPVMIWACGIDKKRNFFNKSWLAFTGRKLKEELDDRWAENIHPDDLTRYFNTYSDAFDCRKEFKIEYRLRKFNGDYRWLFDHGVPHYTAEDEFSGFVGSCIEIQEMKEADDRKDEFISAASHELKSPVTTMKAYIQMLQELTMATQQGEYKFYLLKVEQQINKLIKLIGNLLDLTKIQANNLQLDKESFKFKDLMDEIEENHNASTSSHRLEVQGDSDFVVFADRDRLGQVLYNLIDNAKKYSPHADKISLHVSCDGQDVKIRITDYGIGISSEDQLKIFDRFYRSANASKKSFPGLGIGLFLSMQIIRGHNGNIQVESESGNGSTFILRLPVK
jgi:PAS domain S-box-containing protein